MKSLSQKDGTTLSTSTNVSDDTPFVLTKHDLQNLECKMDFTINPGFDLNEPLRVQITCVFPSSLHVSEFSKQELWSDFDSRTRIFTQNTESSGNLAELLPTIEKIDFCLKDNCNIETLRPLVQQLGFLSVEFLKVQTKINGRFLWQAFSLFHSTTPRANNFAVAKSKLQSTENKIELIRNLLLVLKTTHLDLASACAEYIHHQYIRYVDHLLNELTQLIDTTQDHATAQTNVLATEIKSLLDGFLRSETDFKFTSGLLQNMDCAKDHEELLMRMCAQKKFFQSGTYVNAQREEYLRRFTEPLASASAAVAACAAAFVQYVSESQAVQWSAGGIGFLALGVMLYVFRDRLKDRGRVYLQSWLGQRVPEIEESLQFQNSSIGKVRKWLYQIRGQQIEAFVPGERFDANEVGLQFREDFIFSNLTTNTRHVRLHHIVRVNFLRYMRFMDDRKKRIKTLNNDGLIEEVDVNRFYPLWIHVKHQHGHKLSSEGLFRVLVSQEGIHSVDALPNTKA